MGFDGRGGAWDNRRGMRRIAALVIALAFLAVMVHFFYAADHCPVHCPSQDGRLGHVHPHHADASVCLCFWASLSGPEAEEFGAAEGLTAPLSGPAEARPLAAAGADIAHPPKPLLV